MKYYNINYNKKDRLCQSVGAKKTDKYLTIRKGNNLQSASFFYFKKLEVQIEVCAK